jgi:hypothetical protein
MRQEHSQQDLVGGGQLIPQVLQLILVAGHTVHLCAPGDAAAGVQFHQELELVFCEAGLDGPMQVAQ